MPTRPLRRAAAMVAALFLSTAAPAAPADAPQMVQHLMTNFVRPSFVIPRELQGPFWEAARALADRHLLLIRDDLERQAQRMPDGIDSARAYAHLRTRVMGEFWRWTGDVGSFDYRLALARSLRSAETCTRSEAGQRIWHRRMLFWAGLPASDWLRALALESALLDRWGQARRGKEAALPLPSGLPGMTPAAPAPSAFDGFNPDLDAVTADGYRTRCEQARRQFLEATLQGREAERAVVDFIEQTASDAVDVLAMPRAQALVPSEAGEMPEAAAKLELGGSVEVMLRFGPKGELVAGRIERRTLRIPGAAPSDLAAFETLLDFASLQQARRAVEAAVAKGKAMPKNGVLLAPIVWNQ